MASIKDILNYYRTYWISALISILATSIFEILDLFISYSLGQILNCLSNRPLDSFIQSFVKSTSVVLHVSNAKDLSFEILLGIIFFVSVVRSPVQPWASNWFHWAIPLQARCDQEEKVIEKILTLLLKFYDEHNPGRIAGRVARGITSHTWSYPEIAGQIIPKLFKIIAVFYFIFLVEKIIAFIFLITFIIILWFSFRNLKTLIHREQILDRYIENTESRTSEIITNIKTVKAFATEAIELNRQSQRFRREKQVILYRIHKGYVKLAAWQRTVVQCCLFAILSLTLLFTIQGHISLGHFIMTFTISSIAYSELEPLSRHCSVKE
jgi:ATP-binding cassette subfamily B protein